MDSVAITRLPGSPCGLRHGPDGRGAVQAGVRPRQRRTAGTGQHLNVEDLLDPVTNSRWAISRPVPRSTTPTPHFSSGRRAASGMPPKVEVSRIFDRPTKAKRSTIARPRV